MIWSLLVVGSPPHDLDGLRAAAGVDDHLRAGTRAEVAESLEKLTTPGVVIVGDDRALAWAAAASAAASRRPALVLVAQGSDLLRMFGLDRDAAIKRLAAGERYAVDLGWLSGEWGEVPFVSWVRARRGRMPRPRPTGLSAAVGGREYRLHGYEVLVNNAQHTIGDLAAPRAAAMDGLLDVQVYSSTGVARRRLARLRSRGLHLRARGVWRRSTPEAYFDLEKRWRVAADGRWVGVGAFSTRVDREAFDLWI